MTAYTDAAIPGEPPGIRSNDLWLFSRASIETFLETGRWPSPAGADRLEAEELAKIRMLLERMDSVIVALGILDDVDSAETLPRGRRRIA